MNTKTSSFLIAFAAVAALATLSAGAASANELSSEPSVTVKYAELNLGSTAGVAILYKRIHTAAMTVCSAGSTEDLSRRRLQDACVQTAEAKAVAKVQSATLAAYYQEKTGHSLATFAAN